MDDAANIRAWDALYADTVEPVWGAVPADALGSFLSEVRPALSPGSSVLDAATGEGRHLGVLHALPGTVFACDASQRALAKIPPESRADAHLARCNLARLPFRDGVFDLVLIWDTLETLPELDPALADLGRVLRPGGLLLANIPGPDDEISGVDMQALGDDCYVYRGRYFYRFAGPRQARGHLERAGLEVVRWEKCTWEEGPHARFRDEPHTHTSNVFLARRG